MDPKDYVRTSGSEKMLHDLSEPAGTNPWSGTFQSNIGASTAGSALLVEPLTAIAPDGDIAGAFSVMPPPREPVKKRGRHRKYEPGGTTRSGTKSPPWMPMGMSPGTGHEHLSLSSYGSWQLRLAGTDFTAHILDIASGEDILRTILSFSQQQQRALCILSATGAISFVTLKRPSSPGGTVTHEGPFEMLSLSGSYLPVDNGSFGARIGDLCVSLISHNGRLVGGRVTEMFTAEGPVQVIVGTFLTRSNSVTQSRANSVDTHAMRTNDDFLTSSDED